MRKILILLAAAASLTACYHCPVCYEDEWSREPFPGQAKQDIPPLTPETLPGSMSPGEQPTTPPAN